MDLTMLLQGRSTEDQIGYHAGFSSLVTSGHLSGYRAFPYRGATTIAEWKQLTDEALCHMRESDSDALLCQFFHWRGDFDPRPFLRAVRALPQRPIIATSCGDAFGPSVRPAPRSLLRSASESDVVFSTSMGRFADQLLRAGARRVVLMPLGACDVRFGDRLPVPPDKDREFDVVFIGSRSGGRNPTSHQYWAGQQRSRYVHALARRYGARFGLFGHGWEGLASWQGPVAFNEQVSASQRGRVVFGGYPGSRCDYYASNRPFMALLGGAPFVDVFVPKVDRLLNPGSEWTLVGSRHGALDQIDGLLDLSGEEREVLGATGSEAVRSRHMDSHRSSLIARVLGELAAAQRSGREPERPHLDFFHNTVDQRVEAPTALRGWSLEG